MEYQGVHVATREVWFHKKFELGTNNIGEFLALVHGIAELKRRNLSIPIYTDSMTALAWLRQKKCKTKLEQTNQTNELFNLVERAENWLKSNNFDTPILKWETEIWGEIPADFGRK
jgi:ribonuclease HI